MESVDPHHKKVLLKVLRSTREFVPRQFMDEKTFAYFRGSALLHLDRVRLRQSWPAKGSFPQSAGASERS
jgi:hypothetical protein